VGYGPNIAPNPQFLVSEAPYVLSGDSAPNIHAWEAGRLHIKRSGGDAFAQTPVGLIIPGVSFLVRVGAEVISGTGRLLWTGGSLNFTTSGETQAIFTPSGAGPLYLYAGANTEVFYDWITVRRSDQSMSKVVLTLRDYDGDKKQTSVELGPVTDGPSYVTREAQAAAIRDAVNTVAGNIANYDFLAQSDEPNNLNTATPVFQTHVRWIVELFDSVTGDGPYAFDIPTADLGTAGLFLPASVEHDPAHAAWIALKAALNGIVINPRTASTMTVGRIYLEE